MRASAVLSCFLLSRGVDDDALDYTRTAQARARRRRDGGLSKQERGPAVQLAPYSKAARRGDAVDWTNTQAGLGRTSAPPTQRDVARACARGLAGYVSKPPGAALSTAAPEDAAPIDATAASLDATAALLDAAAPPRRPRRRRRLYSREAAGFFKSADHYIRQAPSSPDAPKTVEERPSSPPCVIKQPLLAAPKIVARIRHRFGGRLVAARLEFDVPAV